MSRSASHTSLASFGPGNPNPYASKPKQRIRPKAPEPPKRAALASPDAAKKIEVKDGESHFLLVLLHLILVPAPGPAGRWVDMLEAIAFATAECQGNLV